MSYIDISDTILEIYEKRYREKYNHGCVTMRKENDYSHEIINHVNKSYVFIFPKVVQFVGVNICVIDEIIEWTGIEYYTININLNNLYHVVPNAKLDKYDIVYKTEDYEIYMRGTFLFSLYEKDECTYYLKKQYYYDNIDQIIEDFIKKAYENKTFGGVNIVVK